MPRLYYLKIHHLLKASRANGPGLRAVVWMQGCSLGCPGCFNPETHDFKPGVRIDVEELARELVQQAPGVEGITVSGGEPFQQPSALAALLSETRRTSSLSIIVFSGYTLDELRSMPSARAALSSIDVLIAGRYEQHQRLAAGLMGSANKIPHFLTSRYRAADLETVPEAEVFIEPDGGVLLSGIRPLQWPLERRKNG